MARPTQKLPATPERSTSCWRSAGGRPRSSIRSRPFSCDRSAVGELRRAAVDLRAVPPVGVAGDVGRRPGLVGARVGHGAQDLHRVLGPRIVLLERDLPGVLLLGVVAQPVVHLELDPGPGQQVERGRRLEAFAREEPPADEARVRVEQPLRLVRVGVLERHVPPESAPERAHQGVVEVVVGAVQHPRAEVSGDVGVLERRLVELPAAGVVEVLRAQPVAKADQDRDGGHRRQPRPAERPVDLLGEVGDKPGQLPRHVVPFPRTARP